MKAAERVEREQKILHLWIAGASYPRIAQVVELSARQVERVVRSALAAGASRRALLTEEALAVHQERFDRLFNAHFGRALEGDHKSAELCRKMLDQNARLQNLYEDATPLPAPTTTPLTSDDSDAKESEEPVDELSKLRARRGTAG
ncbi:hypothetical protein A5733_01190 [Mycobacterium sp. NS-7484]|uniref:hypothetical protein n=1 Tax=Mycobacterium sp. NS-7484 TaxID=1834161 RepID=UPI00096FCBC0|nr:hypothetical protein [Mycobacterium sp. NS-7484]OMB98416.1 hypothetical protein A5733_01190 [Mycobacterium sp. NS-7484]